MSDAKPQSSVNREKGIIYVVTGRKMLPELFQSIDSVKKAMPHVPISLFTDQTDIKDERLDLVLQIKNPLHQFADKIQPLIDSPYQKTLYLDTDTYMAESVETLYIMLDRYDVLAVQDPWRNDYPFEEVPDCFPTVNGGVLAVRKCPVVEDFLKSWFKNHFEIFEKKQRNDQPALRYSLFHSKVNLFILPPEFNMRTYHPCLIGGHARVKIIHERNRYAPQIARIVNKGYRPRIYGMLYPGITFFYYYQKGMNILRRRLKRLFGKK